MAGVHVGRSVGVSTTLGTTRRGDSLATRGMIGIGTSATAVDGVTTSGGVGADTTTLGVQHLSTITTTTHTTGEA